MMRHMLAIVLVFLIFAVRVSAMESLEKAEALFSEGEFRKASNIAEKILKEQPDNIRAGILLAECHNSSKKFMKAISTYKDLIKKAPDNMELVFRLGIVYNNAGYHENAADAYKQVVAAQPGNMEAHHRLGVSYALCMDLSDAYGEYRILKKHNEKLANDLLEYIQTTNR